MGIIIEYPHHILLDYQLTFVFQLLLIICSFHHLIEIFASRLLIRYCNHLDLPPNVQPICGDIIKKAREYGIADGRSPVSIAGGAIYFTTHLLGRPKTAREISEVAGVSESTIKLVYRLYYAEREKLVEQKWIDEGRAKMERLPMDNSR